MHGKFYYITLIMDLFNHEVVGYSASKSLRTEDSTLPALMKVKKNRGRFALEGTIIHSDGGGQYYSKEFRKHTAGLKMTNSMTEESDYANSHAERLNGTIKNMYLYPYAPGTFEKIEKEMKRAVTIDNYGKPNQALSRMTPVQYRIENSVDFENNSKRAIAGTQQNSNNKS